MRTLKGAATRSAPRSQQHRTSFTEHLPLRRARIIQRSVNQKKNYLTTPKESGFTLVEVIVAVAILSFVIFATLRVITASLNSITRQGQRVKALHLAQAHLAKLEAESFSKVVPENFVVPPTLEYQLKSITSNSQIVDKDGSGDASTGDFELRQSDGAPILSTTGWSYDSASRKIIGIPTDEVEVGQEVYLEYKYYHLVEEGGTVPSDGGGLEERIVKLISSVGDTDGNGTPSEKSDILGNDLTDNDPLSPSDDYESYNPETGELTFIDKIGNSVWIYYLPQKTTDSDGDGYEDPTDDSILGVVEGSFYNPDGSPPDGISNTKKVTVTEYWKQGKDIQRTEQQTYITR